MKISTQIQSYIYMHIYKFLYIHTSSCTWIRMRVLACVHSKKLKQGFCTHISTDVSEIIAEQHSQTRRKSFCTLMSDDTGSQSASPTTGWHTRKSFHPDLLQRNLCRIFTSCNRWFEISVIYALQHSNTANSFLKERERDRVSKSGLKRFATFKTNLPCAVSAVWIAVFQIQ